MSPISTVQLQNLPAAATPPPAQQNHTGPPLAQPNAPQPNPSHASVQHNTPQPNPSVQGQHHATPSLWARLKLRIPTRIQMAVLGLALGLLSLVAALIGLVPGFQGGKYGKISTQLAKESLELDEWQAKVTFRAWCQEKIVRHFCFIIVVNYCSLQLCYRMLVDHSQMIVKLHSEIHCPHLLMSNGVL